MTKHLKDNFSNLLRGSIVRLRRKCGKNCGNCQKGELHESWVLSYSHEGRTRMVSIQEEQIPLITRGIERYQKAMAKLNSCALTGIRKLKNWNRKGIL